MTMLLNPLSLTYSPPPSPPPPPPPPKPFPLITMGTRPFLRTPSSAYREEILLLVKKDPNKIPSLKLGLDMASTASIPTLPETACRDTSEPHINYS